MTPQPVAKVTTFLADLPNPTKAQYHLGPIPIRMYAMCILAGILVAVWLGGKRWRARGGRLYHVITSSGLYLPAGPFAVDAHDHRANTGIQAQKWRLAPPWPHHGPTHDQQNP
ncbi:MAG: prolipoprotein diacylglyceryl transferase [Actinomycetia bacterium]|nr:prolipoprotein diacylglyceryl transferase [Actinomycetes bacterium]